MEEVNKKEQNAEPKQNYFDLSEVLRYYFRKKDPNRKPNFSLRMMHGINKISILMFLMAFVVWLIRRLFIA